VYAKAVGLGDRELGVPMRVDTICRLMSQSKPITSVAAMILVERGLLSLKDPISKWNRQFK
jgi:CubicO group peptidase (beta-lactamase class C family)